MARLNTTQPNVLGSTRRTPRGTPLTAGTTGRERDGATRKEKRIGEKKDGMNQVNLMKSERRSQQGWKTGLGRNNCGIPGFDIFVDEDSMGDTNENDTPGHDCNVDVHRDRHKRTTPVSRKHPLKTAEGNVSGPRSLSRARQRRHRRTTRGDFDKENDLVEDAMDDYATYPTEARDISRTSPRRSPTRRRVGETPERDRNGRAETSDEDERGKVEEEGDKKEDREEEEEKQESSHDNSFDSLDGFIVSDNEEISYYDTSDAETEYQKIQETPSPSPPLPPLSSKTLTAKRRLLRGRRPAPKAEEPRESLDDTPSKQDTLRLEHTVPDAVKLHRLTLSQRAKETIHDDLKIAEKFYNLNLGEDNDPSSQLEMDIPKTVATPNLETTKPKFERETRKTPPSTPSQGRIRSPTKQKVWIPATPHRESTDDFWSQEIINDWIDQHSPQKELPPPRAVEELQCDFSDLGEEQRNGGKSSNDDNSLENNMGVDSHRKAPKSPSKTALRRAEAERRRESRARKKSFDDEKAAMAENFLKVLDDAVSGGQVQKLAATTGGVRIVWLPTLKSTAGRARWRRVNPASPTEPMGHHAAIELAEHVIDDEDRLINTMAHEYCHLANYMISENFGERAHGKGFKKWGSDCEKALQDHPIYGGRINVTTKHNYQINYKYVWSCTDCSSLYQRHSKSINPTVVACGRCHGYLQQIKPKPRKQATRSPVKGVHERAERAGAACAKDVDNVAKVFEDVSLS